MNNNFKLTSPEETERIVKERLYSNEYQYYLKYKWKYNPANRCQLPGAIVNRVKSDYHTEFSSDKLKSNFNDGMKTIGCIILSYPVVAALAYLLKDLIWAIWCFVRLALIPFFCILDFDSYDPLEADNIVVFKGFMIIYGIICFGMVLYIVFQEKFIDGATQYTTKNKKK